MSMTTSIPTEYIAISFTITFLFFLLIIRKTDNVFFKELLPWVFYILGWFSCMYNISGKTINFDFLHLALLAFVMGIALQLDTLRRSNQKETKEGK